MAASFSENDVDQEEALNYRPGQRVELKANPGVVDIIAEYDPMMVPSIWLVNDTKPRYPHELNLLPQQNKGMSWLRLSKRSSVAHPARQSGKGVASSYR